MVRLLDARKGESGDGDHATPYSVFIDTVYAAIADKDPRNIPTILHNMARVFMSPGHMEELDAFMQRNRKQQKNEQR